MKDSRLAELNFQDLLDYGGQPPVRNLYPRPIPCTGYCVSCEDAGLLENTGMRLDLMSHGCDSSDFEHVLGPAPVDGPPVNESILFLLENPGGEYGNGAPVEFRQFRKQPPVNHYYWTPSVETWPCSLTDFKGNFYGPYFAYLMRKHQLRNVYITNLVKCKWVTDSSSANENWDPSVIIDHCVHRYLTREVDIFAPKVAFCFGRKAEAGFRQLLERTGRVCGVVYLWHPAAIEARSQAFGKSQEEMVRENDQRVAEAIRQLA